MPWWRDPISLWPRQTERTRPYPAAGDQTNQFIPGGMRVNLRIRCTFGCRIVDYSFVKEQFARFISDFKQSSRSSRTTDRLFAIALASFILIMLFGTLPDWLFWICALIGVVATIAGIISLARDNRREQSASRGRTIPN